MTIRSLSISALAALTVLAVPAFADTPKEDITKSYSAINRALKQKNLNTALSYMTPDYVSVNKEARKWRCKRCASSFPTFSGRSTAWTLRPIFSG